MVLHFGSFFWNPYGPSARPCVLATGFARNVMISGYMYNVQQTAYNVQNNAVFSGASKQHLVSK